MSKHAPALYGDKLTVAGDPNAPLLHVHTVQTLEQLGDEELEILERFCETRLAALEAAKNGEDEQAK